MTFFPKGTFKSYEKKKKENPRTEPLFPVGTKGITKTKMMPSGRIQIEDQILDVLSTTGALDAGIEIEVVGQDVNQPKIRRLEPGRGINSEAAAS